ncbi:DUF6174 domain-containing protein [Dehalogenimonas alkenigignens]|uniref:Uncharacterized protein n=1 Tax=Dehalogenimonas alkenigignens TaxID=1217799 RepID=A0A0W0GG23_9CHLR|nr:DUF6174 domain-containing protein [Dehalogenimonas alkenigignens]KTB47504.1 hypothetical protein DEALK_03490 [Dehalogenimonas alkenigignens]PVV83438.1 hypothetical protein DD509_06285 [Dehalogenimonas alkenigignens]
MRDKASTVLIVLLLVAIAGSLFPGCDLVIEPLQRDLNGAKAKWGATGITDYEYHLRVACFCPPDIVSPVVVKVANGVNIGVAYSKEPKEVTNDFFKPFDTIDKLFVIIQKALDDKVASLDVKYHPAYGYPVSISIDRIENAIDDEIAYFVDTFNPAP